MFELMKNATNVEATSVGNFAMSIERNRTCDKIAVIKGTVRVAHTGILLCF